MGCSFLLHYCAISSTSFLGWPTLVLGPSFVVINLVCVVQISTYVLCHVVLCQLHVITWLGSHCNGGERRER